MDPDQEYQNVLAAEQHVNAVEAAKKKELEEAHANLKGRRNTPVSPLAYTTD